MDEAEAQKAIKEFGEFVDQNGFQGAVTDLALDVIEILTAASASGGAKDATEGKRFNIALHRAELALDNRLETARDLRAKIVGAAEAAITIALKRGLGI